MIDIHSHILPGVDDGAQNMETALRLIRDAAAGGTREIILTPHCAPSYGFFNYDAEMLDMHFQSLCRAVYERERIPVRLHPGMEVLYEGRQEMLSRAGEYFSLCGSRYLLLEYYFDTDAYSFLEGIETAGECGYIPIVAHPERYECVQEDAGLAAEGRRRGALFQINKGSLAGRHGDLALEAGERMLVRDEADFIASDAHHPLRRGSSLANVSAYVRARFGEERAWRLFEENPYRVVRDLPIGRSQKEKAEEKDRREK